MSRAERLLALMEALRRRRHPVQGRVLADELGISLRTLYRDIAALQAQGAQVEGEAGLGYVLKPGFTLPPLMFSEEEIEALTLGARWVANRTDAGMDEAARCALSKISAVLTKELREKLETSTFLIGESRTETVNPDHVATIRNAIRRQHKVDIGYRDVKRERTDRRIWPFALGFFESVQLIVGWCELRQGFRNFRMDRLIDVTDTTVSYPRHKNALLKEWEETEGMVS